MAAILLYRPGRSKGSANRAGEDAIMREKTMRKIIVCIAGLLSLCLLSGAAGAEVPKTVAGFSLGSNIEEYDQLCIDDTAVPMRDALFLTEVNIEPDLVPGVRGGSLSYGNCKHPGEIIVIKLKFHDRSEKFFEVLLDMYKDAFGKPDEWKGDAFHTIMSWQWNFEDDGERVELLLSHSKDLEFRPGVSIKMTLRSSWLEEYECYEEGNKGPKNKNKVKSYKDLDLSTLVPR